MNGNPDPKSQIPTKSKIPTQGVTEVTGGGKRYDLRDRTLAFSLDILRLTAQIPGNVEGRAIRRQLARSGPSVGANVEEADGAISRAEKRRLFAIARREAQETRYWLKLLRGVWPDRFQLQGELRELDEIIRILSAIIVHLSPVRPV